MAVHVVASPESATVDNAPLTMVKSALVNAATASEKTIVTSDVSPSIRVVSAKVMLDTEGA